MPAPAEPTPAQPRGSGWAKRATQNREFTCPSGEKCLLRPLSPERLLEAGILDKVTRLEGLADQLAQQAEGQPPAAPKMPGREELGNLLETINTLVPLAVLEPVVVPDFDPSLERDDNNVASIPDSDLPAGMVRVSWIDLADRMAIMTESLSSISALDNFRHPR
jgi:hypothetical protein